MATEIKEHTRLLAASFMPFCYGKHTTPREELTQSFATGIQRLVNDEVFTAKQTLLNNKQERSIKQTTSVSAEELLSILAADNHLNVRIKVAGALGDFIGIPYNCLRDMLKFPNRAHLVRSYEIIHHPLSADLFIYEINLHQTNG